MKQSDNDSDFDTWFGIVKVNVLERSGVEFRDAASVRDDWNNDRDAHDVADDIVAEYGERDGDAA
jgi:hypothetical protein